jgi:hypothetical protein
MEKTWKITLATGAVIENLERNGDCFISATPVEEVTTGLAEVVASAEGEQSKVWHNAEFVKCASVDDRCWFTFRELSDAELFRLQMQAKLEYISMMVDVDLEEV